MLVFQITVFGHISYSSPSLQYTFKVYKLKNNYTLKCIVDSVAVMCGSYKKETDALKDLNNKMKQAMKGEYIVQYCFDCGRLIKYPREICKCGTWSSSTEWMSRDDKAFKEFEDDLSSSSSDEEDEEMFMLPKYPSK